jgi:hypothetical protein
VSRTLMTSPRIAKCETPKSKKQETVSDTGISDTGSWGCQELLLQESQNHEMRNAEILKAGDSFGYHELGMSRTLTTGVPESQNAKCQNPKIGTPTKNVANREITPFRGPRYQELKCRNTSSQECRNAKSLKRETLKS